MTLSAIKQILAARDIQLTKSLGQNFLHDGNQLRRIVAAAELHPGDRVLEIGPGLGPLTELLIAQPVEVLAIEKDYRLYEFLKERFADAKNLTLARGDALEYLRGKMLPAEVPCTETLSQPELSRAPSPRPSPPVEERVSAGRGSLPDFREWKLVANLPYSVASPILVELAQSPGRPARMVATLQLEVAQRLMAAPGRADYGVLTLLLQLDYEPAGWFKIPAGCFFPAPDVDSACICLRRRAEPLVSDAERPVFARVVKLGFSQRRKMMMKLLKQEWPADRLERACAELGISPQCRAETLGLEQFVGLTRRLMADA